MPVSSAQVKSAILFAGIRFPGTRVSEPIPTRDHTERLFEYLQVGGRNAAVPAFEYVIPGDPSSAAFFIVGSLMREDSDLTIRNMLMNPYRTAYLRKLQQSGARIEITNRKLMQNELVADARVRSGGPLNPIQIYPEEVPSLIDEIPVLSVFGTMSGLEVSGATELRYKESDRIEAIVSNLESLGIEVEETSGGFRVYPGRLQPGMAKTYGDHRIAMSFAVAGVEVDDLECVSISFPEFFDLLDQL